MQSLFVKLMGAVLVLFAGAALGWRRGEASMRRVHVLEDMVAFLGAVQGELHYRCGRTEEILSSAQRVSRVQVLPLEFDALSAGVGLRAAMDAALRHTLKAVGDVVNMQEQAVWRAALEDLGECPAQEEEQRLAHAGAELQRALDIARAGASQQRRLYRTMGLSLGGAAALLLL